LSEVIEVKVGKQTHQWIEGDKHEIGHVVDMPMQMPSGYHLMRCWPCGNLKLVPMAKLHNYPSSPIPEPTNTGRAKAEA